MPGPRRSLRAAPSSGIAVDERMAFMNIVKWNPLRELEDMQTRLNRFFTDVPARRPESDGLFFADWAPAVDIQETEKEYLIKAELPEMKKEDVKVDVLDGVLT